MRAGVHECLHLCVCVSACAVCAFLLFAVPPPKPAPAPTAQALPPCLQQCLSLAAEVAGPQHHLRAIQLPLNLNEARFFLRPAPGQGEGNFVGWARQSGVAVVAERPLTGRPGQCSHWSHTFGMGQCLWQFAGSQTAIFHF